jgi:hypothetical protein
MDEQLGGLGIGKMGKQAQRVPHNPQRVLMDNWLVTETEDVLGDEGEVQERRLKLNGFVLRPVE